MITKYNGKQIIIFFEMVRELFWKDMVRGLWFIIIICMIHH